MTNRVKHIIPYILIPLIAVLAISFFQTKEQNKKELPKYYQIVALFEDNQIIECTLNLSSGNLLYKTVDEPKTLKKYTVPNVELFIEDTNDAILAYNAENPDNQIVLDNQKSST